MRSRLEDIKREEGYPTYDAVIRDLLHEHDSREMPATSELSEGARADLRAFAEQYHDLIEDADALPEPLRKIAGFVKATIAEGGSDQ